MRRMLKLLAKLYPAEWRKRYGAEYEALLEEGTPRVRDAVDVFSGAMKMQMTTWSFAKIVLPCALVGTLVAVGVSLAVPKRYVSQSVVSVDTSDARSIDNELASQVQDVLASPFLISVIQKENLYPRERARMPLNDVVDLMKKGIEIRPLATSDGKFASAFEFDFVYPDAQVAQRVDDELVSSLMASNLRVRSAGAGTIDSLKDQLGAAQDPVFKARLQSQLGQAESLQLHESFRVINPANLPKSPAFPKPGLFGAGGLFVGLVGGLIVAAICGWRRRVTTAAG